jgi:leucyl/phenylalanyl-tRNA--protein transferase
MRFPNPRTSTTDGIVALGGDLHPDSLRLAYLEGIFPWPVEGLPLTWFCPLKRAILEFSELHIPRSLARAQRQNAFEFSFDRAFDKVIAECAKSSRPGQQGTWITPAMRRAYCQFHELGYAHSVEVWEGQKLVGGAYGVSVEGTFAGESMFFKAPNASKLALLHLIEHLKTKGLEWMDVQVLTPHMKALGAKEIPRDEFLEKLRQTQKPDLKLF